MSRRRRRHHHRPPSNPITTNRLHHTVTGTATEEEPMMIHSHRDDDRVRRPVVHLQPNVIARLMGIDDAVAVPTPPTPAPRKPVAGGIVQFQAQRQPYYAYRGGNDDAEYSGSSSRICLHKMMLVPRSRSRSSRLRRRRHPHEEEELQKMRQDLQAWQASKAPALQTSGARPSDSDGDSRSSLVLQAIAQEDLGRQKMARYGFGFGLGGHTKVTQLPLIKNKKKNGSVAQGEGGPSSEHDHAAVEPATIPDDTVVVTAPTSPCAAAASADEESRDLQEASAAQELPRQRHTPIVLLKPATTCSESDTTTGGVAIGGGGQKTVLLGLPKLLRDANMSALLQEVRNRVQRELTLTAAATTATGGEVIRAPDSAWTIPPLQQINKEDRSNKRLFRSESFRAFRTDRKRNAGTPPATTRHAADIVKSATALSPEKADEESMTDGSLSVLPVVVGVTDGQSFRSECLTMKHRDDDATPASPRLLFRSFSAPESGFSFSLGRLFFSSKQHEVSEPPPAAAAAVTMTSKSVVSAAGFSSFIRGTVSSLRRHGFSSRRKLMMFRRKTHWSWSNKTTSLGAGEVHPAKMEMPICTATPPSHETFNLFKVAQANLSELPPSPVSPLEVAAGHSSRHFFTDLHFTLSELSPKCLSEFEAPATAGESTTSFRTDITAVETACSRDKAYITEVLIAAGLYDDDDGPSSANARVDSMARPMPICDDVFEDVEDMYYYRGDYIVGGGMYDGTDHRMLFDLANEALQSLVVESSRAGSSSSLRRWVVDSTGVSRGKKLGDYVWQQVQALRNPQAQEMQTIDGMVAYEVRRCVCTEVLYEDVYVVGRKIERAIFDELIEDLVASAGGFHTYDCTSL